MKIHNIVIFLAAILFAIFIPYNYVSQKPVSYNRANIEYANILTAACHDAAKTIVIGKDGTVWGEEGTVEDTLSVFYNSLSSAFHTISTPMEDSMAEKTPFVILVDFDGFYLSVNACFDEYGNYIVPDDPKQVNSITTLNTWTDSFDGKIVRFYLTDKVEVTLPDYRFFEGDRRDVYTALSEIGETSGLEFLNDEEQFGAARISTITGRIEDTINYILNTQTVNVDSYNTGYNVTLPELTGEVWSRMLKNPTVISFLQGKQQVIGQRILDVYGYAAGEITKVYPYFIIDGEYRWARRAVTASEVDGKTVYMYLGTEVTEFYDSTESCAKAGAVPAAD